MRRFAHLVCLCALAALSCLLLSCGGSSSTTTTTGATLGSIKIDPESATIGVAQQVTFTVTMRDTNGALVGGYPLVWASSDTNIVAVSGVGVATGIGSGSATVTATGTVTGSTGAVTKITSNAANVTVSSDVASVVVSPATGATTTVGGTFQFSAVAKDAQGNTLSGFQFAWSSSNFAVATIDSTGLATGHAKGTVTIAATAGSVQSNLVTLTVQ